MQTKIRAQRFADFAVKTLLIASLNGCSWIGLQSVSDAGVQGNSASDLPQLSQDGRFIVFESLADNLVANDNNAVSDVFVRDLLLGVVSRVSVDDLGNEANGESGAPGISSDGRYVIFSSTASNLVAGDTNNVSDVFVRDRDTGTTRRISLAHDGSEANGPSFEGVISSDGHYAAFSSQASNLVPDDTNLTQDVFQRFLQSGNAITLASRSNSGELGNGPSSQPSIAIYGEGLLFTSDASNLVPGDTNGVADIFNYASHIGDIARVSVTALGVEANMASSDPEFEDYGSYMTFISNATNLVPNDFNNAADVFFRDGFSQEVSRVSINSSGTEANGDSMRPSLTADARFAIFASSATNLVASDTNGLVDVFAHDRVTGTTSRISVDAGNSVQPNGATFASSASLDGRYVAMATQASNLIDGDTNAAQDIVVRAFPQPAVFSTVPDMLPIGATTSVTVTGTYLDASTNLHVEGAFVQNKVILDENTITADIVVPSDKPAGARQVWVHVPGTGAGPNTGTTAICAGCVTFF